MCEAVSGAAAVASGMKFTGYFRTAVVNSGSKKNERLVMPDGLEWIGQDIAEQKFLFSEEQIAGIDRAVGQDAELRGTGRTSHLCKLGIIHAFGQEARTEDRIGLRRAEPFCCN
jgi:hypothetical protein